MPFRVISRAQAERRQARRSTRQGAEVTALGGRYEAAQKAAREGFQREQQGILSGYQQQMETYGKELSVFEQRAKDFQAKSAEYDKQVEMFNTLTELPGRFTALPIQDRPGTYLSMGSVKSAQELAQFDVTSPTGRALSGLGGVDTVTNPRDSVTRITGFDSANLPSNLVLKQVGTSPAGYPEFQLAQRGTTDPGEFTERLDVDAPTAPAYEGMQDLTAKYSTALKDEQEFFEREVGERKLASQRARRRIGDRPLLSGENK